MTSTATRKGFVVEMQIIDARQLFWIGLASAEITSPDSVAVGQRHAVVTTPDLALFFEDSEKAAEVAARVMTILGNISCSLVPTFRAEPLVEADDIDWAEYSLLLDLDDDDDDEPSGN